MRYPTAKPVNIEQTDSGASGLAWLLAAVLAVTIGLPVVAGMLLRYI
jgi:hypothetical protein